jgi:hypothetical protein
MVAKAGNAERADVTIVGPRAQDSIGASLLTANVVGSGDHELLIGAPYASGPTTEAGDERSEGEERVGMVLIVPASMLGR